MQIRIWKLNIIFELIFKWDFRVIFSRHTLTNNFVFGHECFHSYTYFDRGRSQTQKKWDSHETYNLHIPKVENKLANTPFVINGSYTGWIKPNRVSTKPYNNSKRHARSGTK